MADLGAKSGQAPFQTGPNRMTGRHLQGERGEFRTEAANAVTESNGARLSRQVGLGWMDDCVWRRDGRELTFLSLPTGSIGLHYYYITEGI
ncbi:hypothetical protein TWF481_010780 [Arthrobotrys musiformis]|uniref:Uncharacterized protein n=1 Tax=Arthrobotrys musiformis TaxID=47236 RepID=A0AAV9W3X1_9PEZI